MFLICFRMAAIYVSDFQWLQQICFAFCPYQHYLNLTVITVVVDAFAFHHMWFIIKRLPKLFISLLVFITFFLLGFLLIGCMETLSTFSKAYLMKLEFNKTSELFPKIEQAYSQVNKTGSLADMLIRASYLAMCVDMDSSMACSSTINLSTLSNYSGISIIPVTNGTTTQIDLVLVAKSFSDNCYPRILMSTIALTVLLTLFVFWSSVPLLPGKMMARRIACGLLAITVLLWGLGAMLQHQAVSSIKNMIGSTSMYTMMATLGKRAEGMTWTAFSFLLLSCIGLVALCLRDLLLLNKDKKSQMTKV